MASPERLTLGEPVTCDVKVQDVFKQMELAASRC